MSPPNDYQSSPRWHADHPRAFTLVELLVVMGIILLILGLGVPAFTSLKGSKDITSAAYDIAGTLEQARAYAMTKRTYVWVGFFEEDGSMASTTPKATAGIGRVVICVVASKDGSRYKDATTNITTTKPAPFYAGDSGNTVVLVQLNSLVKLSNTHLTAANVGRTGTNSPDRPGVDGAYQVGDAADQGSPNSGPFSMHYVTTFAGGSSSTSLVINPTTFAYPVGTTSTAQYTFTKVIEFNPQGEASKIVDSITSGSPAWMEVALVPTHGGTVDARYAGAANVSKSAATVQVGGLNGRVRIFRP